MCSVGVLLLLLGLGVTAQAQRLGEPHLSWHTFETPHFRVIFHEGLEGLSQEAAVKAENAYTKLAQELGYAPPDKTDLVVYDGTDFADGFADTLTNKIIIYTSQADLADWFNPRLPSWLELRVFHEYAHIVDTDLVFGFSEALRPLFGRAILPNWKPLIFLEGVAAYLKYKHLGESRANNPREAMYLRAMHLAKKFIPLDQASSSHRRRDWMPFFMISHDYGPWFVRYLEERFGSGTIRKINQLRANDPRAALTLGLLGDLEALLKRVTGLALGELYRDFQSWVGEQFAEQIEKIKSEGLTESQQITKLGHWSTQPSVAPDGRSILYYHSDPARVGGLRIVQGTDDRPLLSSAMNATWSPDGRKILYIKLDWQQHVYLRGDLYLYDLDTKRETRLTQNERVYRAVFFPDGQRILLAKYRWGDQGPFLAVLDLKTKRITPFKEFPFHDYFTHSLAISPDGEKIALSLWRRGGYQDIYLMPAKQALTRDRAVDLDPAFSPDGQYLLFSSDRDGVYNLYAYRLDDGQFFKITNVLTGAFDPEVSPDGRRIAFVSYSLDGYDIHMMPFEPATWKPVQIEPEPFPPWDGFPDTGFPIRPYDPRPSLAPKLWIPLPGLSSFGLMTFGSDALGQHHYQFRFGFDWRTLQPFYRLSYQNSQLTPTLEAQLEKENLESHQSFTATVPIVTSISMRQSLSLFYKRDETGLISHKIGLSWQGSLTSGFDLFRHRFKFFASALTQTRTGQRLWENRLSLKLNETLHLPFEQELSFTLSLNPDDFSTVRAEYRFPILTIERGFGLWPVFLDDLRGRIFAQWDSSLKLGAELELSLVLGYIVLVSPRVGIVWDAKQKNVQFYVRGNE